MTGPWSPRAESNRLLWSTRPACYRRHFEGLEPASGVEPATPAYRAGAPPPGPRWQSLRQLSVSGRDDPGGTRTPRFRREGPASLPIDDRGMRSWTLEHVASTPRTGSGLPPIGLLGDRTPSRTSPEMVPSPGVEPGPRRWQRRVRPPTLRRHGGERRTRTPPQFITGAHRVAAGPRPLSGSLSLAAGGGHDPHPEVYSERSAFETVPCPCTVHLPEISAEGGGLAPQPGVCPTAAASNRARTPVRFTFQDGERRS